MNVHKNARLTPHGRERIVQQVASGQTAKAVGEAAGVCPRTVRKWVDRYPDRCYGTRRGGSRETKRRTDTSVQDCRVSSGTSLSLPAIRPNSVSDRTFIFRIALLRWTFTVASVMPISPAICLLRRPRAT